MIRLLALQIRRDRVTLAIWLLGLFALLAVSAAAVGAEYGDAAGRRQILTLGLATPALLALRGIPNGDSLGSAVHFQSFAFLAVAVGLMNTFLAVRHGRGDEERGRRELLDATPIARTASLAATIVLGLLVNAVFTVLATAGYLAAGLDLGGSLLSAGALALLGFAFFAIAALLGELLPTSRAANTAAAAVVLIAYALRAAGDATGRADVAALTLHPGWASAISPIGWGQATLAFTSNDPLPLLGIAALAVVALVGAVVAHTRRELGASLLRERAGRPAAGPLLDGPLGLAWRLTWPALVPWAVGAGILGAVTGSLTTAVANANLGNAQITAVLQSLGGSTTADTARLLVATVAGLVGLLAAAAGIQTVLRAREEEAEGRLELLLAAPLGRARWLGATLVVTTAVVLTVVGATSIATGLGFLGSPAQDIAGIAVGQVAIQAPAALATAAGAAVLVALLPRIAAAASWLLFGVAATIGLAGGLLNLPSWIDHASPFSDVPMLPTADWWPALAVGGAALVLGVVSLVVIRRRDLAV